MNWLFWFLVVNYALGAILATASVGRPRKPMTAAGAAGVVCADALLILLLVVGWPH